jgi:hypothetical protein
MRATGSSRSTGTWAIHHGGRRDQPDYLIDDTPATVAEHEHRLVISSRALSELKAILRPVLKQYGRMVSTPKADKLWFILEQLTTPSATNVRGCS